MSKKDDDKPRALQLRVVRCDGPTMKVWTIAGTEFHIGNNIADGHLSREDGFRLLACYFKVGRDEYRTSWQLLERMSLWGHIKRKFRKRWL